jgi:hypothetical protein
MDKEILKKWLGAGYMEKGKLYSTELGTPRRYNFANTSDNYTEWFGSRR